MTDKPNSFLEKLARSYVKNCGDLPQTMRECAPAIAEKTDKFLTKHFEQTYNDIPQFWEFVEEYRAEVKKEIALTAADVMMHLTRAATLDCTEFTQVKMEPCVKCWPDRGGLLPRLGCENCGGKGITYVHVTPTAQLSPIARSMYRGAEQTKYGIKVSYADPDKAAEMLARATGLFNQKLDVTVSAQLPELPVDQVEAAKRYSEWIKGGE